MTDVPLLNTIPCSLPARLTAGDVVCRVTVTRLGGAWARISLATPLDPGLPAILEIDRPSDGERAWIRTRVERVHAEGSSRGWKRSVDLALLEFVDRSALTSVGAPELHDGPDTFDHESVSIEVFSHSMEDSADKITPADGTPEQPPRLPMDDARAIARGAFALQPADGQPAPPQRRSLPAVFRPTLERRPEAVTPWSDGPAPVRKLAKREARIMSSSPVAYLTSGRHRSGVVQDFSRHGLFLAIPGDSPLPLAGATIRIEFPVPTRHSVMLVGLMAEVRWAHGGDQQATPGRGAGLQILTFDAAAGREVYERYVDDLLAERDRS
jgi:hypothetical protein